MPPKRKAEPSKNNDGKKERSKKLKGKQKSDEYIPPQEGKEEDDDDDDDFQEAFRLSRQLQQAAASAGSSSSTSRPPAARSNPCPSLTYPGYDDDVDFQPPIALPRRLQPTATASKPASSTSRSGSRDTLATRGTRGTPATATTTRATARATASSASSIKTATATSKVTTKKATAKTTATTTVSYAPSQSSGMTQKLYESLSFTTDPTIASYPPFQSSGMTQELQQTLSLAQDKPESSTGSLAHTSKKIEAKKSRSEAKKQAREEAVAARPKAKSRDTKKRTEARKRKAGRQRFVIKTRLQTMLRDQDFNPDQRTAFIDHIRQVVRHVSDVTYAASLFLNWFCLRKISRDEVIPRLDHNYLYNFAALFIGLGKGVPLDLRTAFNEFTEETGDSFRRERQFPNMQYSTIITAVMRSFETLICNHVGLNFKARTLRYLFTKISSNHEPSYLPLPTGIKRDLAERMYTAISSNQDMTYPETPVVEDAHKTSINELITECRQRLDGLLMTESDCYANPHLYLPWLHHVLERMEQNIFICESVSQTKASKGFVHRQIQTLVDVRRLPRRFRQNLEHHVREAINSERPTLVFASRTFENVNQRRSQARDPLQDNRANDLSMEEKAAVDTFVTETRASIAAGQFTPQKYTDPRGARLFNLLPIHSLQMRFIQINLQGLTKMIKTSRIRGAPRPDESMEELCWSLFNMERIGFHDLNQLEENEGSKGFTGVIRTDGVALEFVCDRPTVATVKPLTPADVAREVDLNTATVWGVDPGVREVFFASDGDQGHRHRIRKTSTSEYYQLAGFKSAMVKRARYDRAHQASRNILAEVPSTKTINRDQLNDALRYIFRNFASMSGYYTIAQRKLHFRNYRKRQKALNEMCKRLFSGRKKYRPGCLPQINQNNPDKWKRLSPGDYQDERTRPVVVAFGASRFGGLRGNVSPPSKLFRAALLHHVKRPKLDLQRNHLHGPKYVVMVDEYLTSQICARCQTRITSNQLDASNAKIHPVLNCQTCETCETRWNRDHMASINIRNVFLHMASNNSNRPELFRPRQSTPA